MHGERICSHDHELDIGCIQGCKHVNEVFVNGSAHGLLESESSCLKKATGVSLREYVGKGRPLIAHISIANGHMASSRS
jgi:hypothetical protein